MAQPGTTYDVAIGDVSQSQIVIGDHATVQTADGVKVVYLVGEGNRPKPRPRRPPAGQVPDAPALLGREADVAAARRAAPGAPLQVAGPDGIGKTALLKHLAHALPPGHDGVVYLRARRRPLDD